MRNVDWSRWTVILLKPDCVDRGLTGPVLAAVGELLTVVDHRTVVPSQQQIFAHYDDMLPLSGQLGRDVPAELIRIFVGRVAGVALAYGENAAPRLRAIIGDTDPEAADSASIRGQFGSDTLAKAVAEGRLVDNLIHSSDAVDVVGRDFGIWYGSAAGHLLREPVHAHTEGSLR